MKPNQYIGDASYIVSEILAYLTERPKAQDTLEGIVEWWLLEQRIKRETTRVKEALAELVARGFVLEERRREGRLHYRMNQHKQKEIQALLEKRAKRRTQWP